VLLHLQPASPTDHQPGRDFFYVGDKGSGKGFKDAKVGLLNE
jgi:hypothetical protein